MSYMELVINNVGNLVITLTNDGLVDLKRLINTHPDWKDREIFLELLDQNLIEGWYVVDPEQIRAQADSLLLTDDIKYDNEGNVTYIGNTYWLPGGDVSGYIQPLLTNGHIIFQRGTPRISSL
jgi:hypothetical protein